MAGAVTIRPWRAADRAAAQALMALLDPAAAVDSDEAPVYVAEAGGEVVGMVTLCVFTTLTGTKAYLDHLVVAEDWRRKGVGRRLVEHAIGVARAAGASRIDLTAGDAKVAGGSLYRAVGFRERDTRNFRLNLS